MLSYASYLNSRRRLDANSSPKSEWDSMPLSTKVISRGKDGASELLDFTDCFLPHTEKNLRQSVGLVVSREHRGRLLSRTFLLWTSLFVVTVTLIVALLYITLGELHGSEAG